MIEGARPRTQYSGLEPGNGQDARTPVGTRVVRPAARLRGEVTVPGDKSISHRALILNAVAEGDAVVSNLGPGADVRSTMGGLRQLGARIDDNPDGSVTVRGTGLRGLAEPRDVLDAGNSGTTTRLLTGLLAGQSFFSVITGDDSLRARPMKRIIAPLRLMGAKISARGNDSLLPMAISGAPLRGIEYRLPVASAQLKSGLLIAGLFAEGPTTIIEPERSRDHTERMLRAQGASLTSDEMAITIVPGRTLSPVSLQVPGDISSAAFWLVAAAVHSDAEITVRDVGMNPGRTGVIDALLEMGADLEVLPRPDRGGEPVADLVARSSRLRGARIGGALIPRLIDEVPILAVAALFAEGETVFSDASELRVKETDRIAAVGSELRRLGGDVQETQDGLIVQGGARLRGTQCQSYLDHRMAMSLAIAGLLAEGETAIVDSGAADVSYPSFWEHLDLISGRVP